MINKNIILWRLLIFVEFGDVVILECMDMYVDFFISGCVDVLRCMDMYWWI